MSSRTPSSGLHNNLNDPELTDEEFEQLRSDYEQEHHDRKSTGRRARFAKIAGLFFLVLASLFVVQQFYFPFGPDLSHLLRLIPSTGTLLVLVIGLGLLTRFSRRKSKRKRVENAVHATNRSSDEETKKSSYHETKRSSEQESGDPYAFQTRKKWWRSRTERMLAGVCGGIAERFQVDPTIVRALFALAFFSYGFSLVIYIVLAVVLPVNPLRTA